MNYVQCFRDSDLIERALFAVAPSFSRWCACLNIPRAGAGVSSFLTDLPISLDLFFVVSPVPISVALKLLFSVLVPSVRERESSFYSWIGL
jgi:hypothetical protein